MIAILVAILCALCAIAAMLYAMHMRIENDMLRAKIVGYIEIINDFMLEDE